MSNCSTKQGAKHHLSGVLLFQYIHLIALVSFNACAVLNHGWMDKASASAAKHEKTSLLWDFGASSITN